MQPDIPNFEDLDLGEVGELEPLTISANFSVPPSINRYLREYQREGVLFMGKRLTSKRGTILGDDMGLGKTIQSLALFAAVLKKTGTNRDKAVIDARRDFIEDKIRKQREQGEAERGAKDGGSEATTVYYHSTITYPPLLVTSLLAPLFASLIAELKDYLETPHSSAISTQSQSQSTHPDLPPPSPFVPILLVVPASVVDNWGKEFNKWGHFSVVIYRGEDRSNALELATNSTAEGENRRGAKRRAENVSVGN